MFYWGTFEGDERDLVIMEIGNGEGWVGLYGKITFGPHTFFMGEQSISFLYHVEKELKSYSTEGYNHVGYNAKDKDGFFNFTIPKMIIVDSNSTTKSSGYIFDYSEIFSDCSSIIFLSLPNKGVLTSTSCGFKTGIPYTSQYSTFKYIVNSLGYDRVIYNQQKKERV